MPTFTDTVTTLLKKINDGQAGLEVTLSPEETMLLAKAVADLSDQADLEQAILAVANGHLDDATNSLNQSTAALNASKDLLDAQSENLNLIPMVRSDVNDVVSEMQLLKNRFELGYGLGDTIIKESQQTSDNYSSIMYSFTFSVENFNSKEFYIYLRPYTTYSSYNYELILRINADGTRSVLSTSTSIAANDFMFVELPDGRMHGLWRQGNTIKLQLDINTMVTTSQAMDYVEIYQDPETKYLYVVSGDTLYVNNGGGFVADPDATTFADQNAFVVWAGNLGYTQLTSYLTTVGNSNVKFLGFKLGAYQIPNVPHYPARVVAGASSKRYVYVDGVFKDDTSALRAGQCHIGRIVTPPTSNSGAIKDSITTAFVTRSPDKIDSLELVSHYSDWGGYLDSNHLASAPVIYGYSYLHNALVWDLFTSSKTTTASSAITKYSRATGMSFGR